MRESRGNTCQKPSRTHPIPASPPLVVTESCAAQPGHDSRILIALMRIADALDRLVEGIEHPNKRLGEGDGTRYTRPPESSGLLDEKTMAAALNISKRTLGRHRRDGRLPGCWLRNGGRILWRVAETHEAWERGIA